MHVDTLLEKITDEFEFPVEKRRVIDQFGDIIVEFDDQDAEDRTVREHILEDDPAASDEVSREEPSTAADVESLLDESARFETQESMYGAFQHP